MSQFRSAADSTIRAADWPPTLRRARFFFAFPLVKRTVYFLALSFLLGGLIVAFRQLPTGVRFENYQFIALLLVTMAPLTLLLNAIELELSANLLDVRLGWRRALKVTVLSSAANMLPLPGGPIIRTAALTHVGADLARSTGVVTSVASQWLGFIILYAGAWLAFTSNPWIGCLVALGGTTIFALSIGWLVKIGCKPTTIAYVSLVKVLSTIVGVWGFWCAFASLGTFLSVGDVSIFAVAGAAGVAVSVVPAGLGVTETMSAALASWVTVSPAVAFLAAAVFRLTWLCFLFPVALITMFSTGNKKTRIEHDSASGSEQADTPERTHAICDRRSRTAKALKIDRILSPTKEIAGAHVADIGAGSGYISEYFIGRTGDDGHVISIDTKDQIAPDISANFQLASGVYVPGPDDQFDIAISNHVIEHVGASNRQLEHLGEIHRVLKQDGVLYLAFPNRWALIEPHYNFPLLGALPRPCADWIVKHLGKGSYYDCYPLSRSEVRSLASQYFEIEDKTKQALIEFIDLELDGAKKKIATLIAKYAYRVIAPLAPTLVFVCKPFANSRCDEGSFEARP